MLKPRVAIFEFACCEGCQLQIINVNKEQEYKDLFSIIDPVQWREAMSEQSGEYDIAVVEGSITREDDQDRLKLIRKQADVLIAIGACATLGGVNKIKNNFNLNEVKDYVYGRDEHLSYLNMSPAKAVDEVVHVDYNVQGCPINRDEFTYILRCLAKGIEPVLADYPVCVECKMRGNICRYEYGELCLGPVTRAGCDAPCPSANFWCFGCRGLVDNPRVDVAREVVLQYDLSVFDLMQKMRLFNSKQEHVE